MEVFEKNASGPMPNTSWCSEAAFCGAFEDRVAGLPSLLSFVVNVCVDELYFAVRPTNVPTADFTLLIDSNTSSIYFRKYLIEPCGSDRTQEAVYEACANVSAEVLQTGCVEGCVLIECKRQNADVPISACC